MGLGRSLKNRSCADWNTKKSMFKKTPSEKPTNQLHLTVVSIVVHIGRGEQHLWPTRFGNCCSRSSKFAVTMHIIILQPSSEIVVYPIISEVVYQNTAPYQMDRLEITKMVKEKSTPCFYRIFSMGYCLANSLIKYLSSVNGLRQESEK